jgi:hypothetical protein
MPSMSSDVNKFAKFYTNFTLFIMLPPSLILSKYIILYFVKNLFNKNWTVRLITH